MTRDVSRWCRPPLIAAVMLVLPSVAFAQERFACTEVLGFSQSMEWYGAFSIAGRRGAGAPIALQAGEFLPGWQGRFTMGAAVERWKAPDYAGWRGTFLSPAPCARDEVDRVVFNVSGAARSVDAWAEDIRAVVARIRTEYPAVRRILLQPVVGGPPGECAGVRAAENHSTIAEAIRRVAGDGLVQVGAMPLVSGCSGFRDALGHLTPAAASAVQADLRAFYRP